SIAPSLIASFIMNGVTSRVVTLDRRNAITNSLIFHICAPTYFLIENPFLYYHIFIENVYYFCVTAEENINLFLFKKEYEIILSSSSICTNKKSNSFKKS